MQTDRSHRPRRNLSVARITLGLVLVLGGFSALSAVQHKVRQLSTSTADARQRGRLIKTPALLSTTAPTDEGTVEIEDVWVEASMRTKWLVVPARSTTGTEFLVLRVRPTGASVHVFAVDHPSGRDTFDFGPWVWADEKVVVVPRRSPWPDTLRFIAPPRGRR